MTKQWTRRRVIAAVGTSLALAGCVGDGDGDGDEQADDQAADDNSEVSSEGDDTSDGEMADENDESETADSDLPEWYHIEMEDVTTGEQFTLADIEEPTVIHTFATYCPICNDQQQKIQSGYEELSQEATFLDLSIDENDDPDSIQSHAEENGFEWRFGVAPNELTRALVDEFGQQVAVYSQSPLVIVCPDGSADTVGKGSDPSEISNAISELCR